MGAYDDGGFTRAKKAAEAAGIPTKAAASPIKVTVERGDTLSSIAKENNTTVNAILAANPKFTEQAKYKGGNTVFAGTTVVIPPKIIAPTYSPTSGTVNTNTIEGINKASGENPIVTSSTPTTDTSSTNNSNSSTNTSSVNNNQTVETNNTFNTSSVDYSPPPVSAEPLTPATTATATATVVQPVKTAPIDTVLFNDDEVPIEVMTDLIFEDIGGQELINIARNDIINGQQVSYQPIKNLSSIQQQYNPNNILSVQSTSDKYFANFPIKLENKIPEAGTGPNNVHVYLDSTTGNLVIEAVNVESDEQIEVEITVSGTIYEAEFGEITS
jgi:hypothetical protein